MPQPHSGETEMKIHTESVCSTHGRIAESQLSSFADTHWRLNADCSWKAGNENPPKRVQPPVLKEGARRAGWAAGGPAKQAQASGSMAASLEIYSIKVGSLPGGFHQLHDLSRQLDLVQKPPLQIAIRGADWARDVCCLWHLSSSVSYSFPLCCRLRQKV